MRALARVILALSTVGCAPAGLLQLAPRETSHSSRANARWIASESSQSTVSASVERAWLDHLLFEVEVVNQSDSALVVEPEQFSLTLSSSAELHDRRPPGPIAPASVERVRARLRWEYLVAPGILEEVPVFASTGCFVTVVGVALVERNWNPTDGASPPDPRLARQAEAGLAIESLPQSLLGRTELAPGGSVRGRLWFPAKTLRRVIHPESPDQRRHIEYGLTLQAPAALGGQQIDYFAWRK